MSLRFMVVSSATNKVVGQLEPSAWELTETVKAAGSGNLTIPVPQKADTAATERAKAYLRRATQPRKRWVAAVDENDKVLWAGPILKPITYQGGGLLKLDLIDWRAWFYRCHIRPGFLGNGIRTTYKRLKTEQGTLFNDVIRIGLDHPQKPAIVRDIVPTTGVKKDLTTANLDRSVGDVLDDMQGRPQGAEWFTYASLATNTMTCVPHIGVGFPERTTKKIVRLEWREGIGGNLAESPTWPESEEAWTQAWGVGDDEPPKTAFSSDKHPDLGKAGTEEILWETVVGPLAGVKKPATAFEYARAEVRKGIKAYGTWEVSVANERLDPASYVVGDRARVILRNAWDDYDLPTCRIVSRTLTGGRSQPSLQKLSVDLADYARPPAGGRPGLKVDVVV